MMAEQNKRTSYPTDLSDAEWQRIAPHRPTRPSPRGRQRLHASRAIVNAICSVVRSGCAWRLLPHDLPPWQTVYHYFRRWRQDGTWARSTDALRTERRSAAGHDPQPSAASLDSQAGTTTEQGGPRGDDAGKQGNGRARQLLVDTLGVPLMVVVHAANGHDRDGAKLVFEKVKGRLQRLRLIWADGGYTGQVVDWVTTVCGWGLEIIKRTDDSTAFRVLPRRWVVERTFVWLGTDRRLSKDDEYLPERSEA